MFPDEPLPLLPTVNRHNFFSCPSRVPPSKMQAFVRDLIVPLGQAFSRSAGLLRGDPRPLAIPDPGSCHHHQSLWGQAGGEQERGQARERPEPEPAQHVPAPGPVVHSTWGGGRAWRGSLGGRRRMAKPPEQEKGGSHGAWQSPHTPEGAHLWGMSPLRTG